MTKRLILLFFGAVLSFSVHAQKEIAPEKKVLIETLLEQTGQSSAAIGSQFSRLFTQQIITALKQSRPEIDPKIFDIVQDEVNAVINGELIVNDVISESMLPAYDKYFTVNELKEMVAFNNTELGQKLIRVMPLFTQEGMRVGQEFGQAMAPKVNKRIQDRLKFEGYN